eukprot:4117869-Prymnesium_polylepis.1
MSRGSPPYSGTEDNEHDCMAMLLFVAAAAWRAPRPVQWARARPPVMADLLLCKHACSSAEKNVDVPLVPRADVDPNWEQPHVEAAVRIRGADVLLLSSSAAGDAGSELEDGRIVLGVPAEGEEAAWAASSLPAGATVRGVVCGDDGGLADAERLAHALIPERANGILPARRDKYAMNDVLRAAGMPTVAQAAPASWDEAVNFVRGGACGLPVVIKPRRGVASILVGLAHTEEVRRATRVRRVCALSLRRGRG